MTTPTDSFSNSAVLSTVPTVAGLGDDEQRLVQVLAAKLATQQADMQVRNAYYEGTQRLASLGISIPAPLERIRVVVDWPRVCVDPLVQRAVVDGFRLPDSLDADTEMHEHWQANNLDAEIPMGFLDALVFGRGYAFVGSPDTPGGSPLVTVESALTTTGLWDPRRRALTAAWTCTANEIGAQAVLALPDVTITLQAEGHGPLREVARDEHRFGQVPVVMLPNRRRSHLPDGMSEISSAVMSSTDRACRTLLGIEIGREFYAVPHRYVLGAKESDFVDSQGKPKTALQMSMNKFLALERDEDGELPVIGQFSAFDPTVFTKIVDEEARLLASYTQFPPDWFGMSAQSNPASADAIRSAQDGVNRRARQVHQQFSDPLEDMQRLIWRFANGGREVPAEYRRIETDWVDPATPTPAATSDAMAKLAAKTVDILPAHSTAVLRRLGFTAVERRQIQRERDAVQGDAVLTEIANTLGAGRDAATSQPAADSAAPTA